MGHTHPKFVSWAAQDGRVEDLVYHLQLAGKNSLNFSALEREKRAPIHLAAIGGHTSCVKVLFEAGERSVRAETECNFISNRFLAGGEGWGGAHTTPSGCLQPALPHGTAATVSRSQP